MTSAPIKLLIHGASGRMGRALLRLASADPRFQLVAAVSRTGLPIEGVAVSAFAAAAMATVPPFDVAVDFSLPGAFDAILRLCRERRAGLVSGTTGLSDGQRADLAGAGSDIPLVWASNYSLGVVVLDDLVRRATAALPGWRADIVEAHHVHKKDAPSGTALTLAQAHASISGVMPPIESIREGEVVGLHTVRLSGPGEALEMTHRAGNRDIFALGALLAASRLVASPKGAHRLADLFLGGASR